MIEKVLNRKNFYKAYREVVRNKGSAGVDGMQVTELFSYLENNRDRIATSILNHTYVPQPIKGGTKRELRAGPWGLPKNNGKTRLLGVPTAVERWLQQAVSQVLMAKYELTFEEHSYGFRPEKNIHKAVTQSLKYRAERKENVP
ncbi:Mobile element protein [Lunatimonas lonarensis]|uniref:Mobile element protein n=1 Tax=Lunatimonas lonarensis TaxID=1232681 RepID=R7ZWL4_9BACT|nr:Mobile element protein [Lunatimonas lonarensis]EON78399.1 Mobile element protein [Lunatimonas lonarensis]